MKASFSRIINANTPVLVDFYADWCAPCKMLSPVLKDVKETLGDQVKIIKIDVDKNTAIASRFQVRGVPTLILFKDGRAVWRQSGVLPKPTLLEAVRAHL